MKNLEDYSAKPVCPSSYLTRLHMELGKSGKKISNITDLNSVKLTLLVTQMHKTLPVLLLYVAERKTEISSEMPQQTSTYFVTMCFVLTDLTVMDRRWHVAGHYDIAAEVLLNQVRVQRVRCVWSLVSRT